MTGQTEYCAKRDRHRGGKKEDRETERKRKPLCEKRDRQTDKDRRREIQTESIETERGGREREGGGERSKATERQTDR